MDQKAKHENIIFDIEKHSNVEQEVHEMPNRGIILKPRSLWTEEQPTGHRVSSISIEMKWKVWTRGPQKRPNYRKQSPVKGIMFEIYPRERGIHTFQTPLIIQEHGDDKNLMDKLLLVNLINSSNPKYVHNR